MVLIIFFVPSIISDSLSSKNLRLNFFEDCINKSPDVCRIQQRDAQAYLNFFTKSNKKECLEYKQIADSMNNVLQFCVDMGNSSWYGGAEVTHQYWPLNKLNWTDRPYVTREEDSQAVRMTYFVLSDCPTAQIISLLPRLAAWNSFQRMKRWNASIRFKNSIVTFIFFSTRLSSLISLTPTGFTFT